MSIVYSIYINICICQTKVNVLFPFCLSNLYSRIPLTLPSTFSILFSGVASGLHKSGSNRVVQLVTQAPCFASTAFVLGRHSAGTSSRTDGSNHEFARNGTWHYRIWPSEDDEGCMTMPDDVWRYLLIDSCGARSAWWPKHHRDVENPRTFLLHPLLPSYLFFCSDCTCPASRCWAKNWAQARNSFSQNGYGWMNECLLDTDAGHQTLSIFAIQTCGLRCTKLKSPNLSRCSELVLVVLVATLPLTQPFHLPSFRSVTTRVSPAWSCISWWNRGCLWSGWKSWRTNQEQIVSLERGLACLLKAVCAKNVWWESV